MVRVAIGGLEHETNTYATAVTGLTTHANFAHARGAAILRTHSAARTQLGGHIVAGVSCNLKQVVDELEEW